MRYREDGSSMPMTGPLVVTAGREVGATWLTGPEKAAAEEERAASIVSG